MVGCFGVWKLQKISLDTLGNGTALKHRNIIMKCIPYLGNLTCTILKDVKVDGVLRQVPSSVGDLFSGP